MFVGFAAALTIGLIGWRGAVLALGSVAVVVAIAILIAVREAPPSEADRTAAETPVRHLYRKVLVDRDLRWVYAAAVLGGGSRGLGVLNIFVPLYLAEAVGLDAGTIGLDVRRCSSRPACPGRSSRAGYRTMSGGSP